MKKNEKLGDFHVFSWKTAFLHAFGTTSSIPDCEIKNMNEENSTRLIHTNNQETVLIELISLKKIVENEKLIQKSNFL